MLKLGNLVSGIMEKKLQLRAEELCRIHGKNIMMCIMHSEQAMIALEIAKRAKEISSVIVYPVLENVLVPRGMLNKRIDPVIINGNTFIKRVYVPTEMGKYIMLFIHTSTPEKNILKALFLSPEGVSVSALEKGIPKNTIDIHSSIYSFLDHLIKINLVIKEGEVFFLSPELRKAIDSYIK